MVTPLNLVHVDLSSTGETDIFFQNMDWSLTVGQVVVEVNGILINFLEGLGLVRGTETVGTPVYHPEFLLCIQFMIPLRPS
jgi:hypothetical protein